MLGQQLSWQVCVGDIAIMSRELVAVQTERADPELSPRIDLAIIDWQVHRKRKSVRWRVVWSMTDQLLILTNQHSERGQEETVLPCVNTLTFSQYRGE